MTFLISTLNEMVQGGLSKDVAHEVDWKQTQQGE